MPTGDPVSVLSTPHTDRLAPYTFISYAQDDEAWAEWVAIALQRLGHRVELPLWDWDVGTDGVQKRADALAGADRVVAIFSSAYFAHPQTTVPDWSAVLSAGERDRLVPVYIERLQPRSVPFSLRPIESVWLAGLTEGEADNALKRAFGSMPRSRDSVRYPGTRTASGADLPRYPGVPPRLVDVPPRDKAFVDRPRCFAKLRDALARTGAAALHGPTGTGKTALALEYAHRHAAAYDTVCWITAGEAAERPPGTAAGGRELVVVDGADGWPHVPLWARDSGHLIVTSKHDGWHKLAAPVRVGAFERDESIELLSRRGPRVSQADAERVCERLTDHPLVVEQAATVLNTMTVEDYLTALEEEPARMLDEPSEQGPTLTGLVRRDLKVLAEEDEAAAQMLLICALLGPGPVPKKWFTGSPGVLPEPLRTAMRDPVEAGRRARPIRRLALADVRPETLDPAPLVRLILRAGIAGSQEAELRECAGRLLVAAVPGRPEDPRTWPDWRGLAPRVTALDPAAMTDSRLRRLACQVCQFLQVSGDMLGAHRFAARLYAAWERTLGPKDRHVHNAAAMLAIALRTCGQAPRAAELNRRCRDWAEEEWGAGHEYTLAAMNNLVLDLRQMESFDEAYELAKDTITRARRLDGDHEQALKAADNLALILRSRGSPEAAYQLNEETHERKVLLRGSKHPTTLITSANMAMDLEELGELEKARDRMAETLDHMSEVMGADHPHTRAVRSRLARLRDDQE